MATLADYAAEPRSSRQRAAAAASHLLAASGPPPLSITDPGTRSSRAQRVSYAYDNPLQNLDDEEGAGSLVNSPGSDGEARTRRAKKRGRGEEDDDVNDLDVNVDELDELEAAEPEDEQSYDEESDTEEVRKIRGPYKKRSKVEEEDSGLVKSVQGVKKITTAGKPPAAAETPSLGAAPQGEAEVLVPAAALAPTNGNGATALHDGPEAAVPAVAPIAPVEADQDVDMLA